MGDGPCTRASAVVAARRRFRQTPPQRGTREPLREGRMGKIRSLLSAALAALALAPAPPAAADTVKVGVILPYSGPFASLASIMDDAIKLWVKQNGDSVGATKIELIRRDTTGPN